jgi:hypothetical protein
VGLRGGASPSIHLPSLADEPLPEPRAAAVGDERSRITYRMEITGPAAETLGPEIGPEISGDFPQVLAALAARAESRA